MIPLPDLSTPEGRAIYRGELRGIARPIRYMGVILTLAGLGLALFRHLSMPTLPAILPLVFIILGVLHMLAGMLVRMRYHQRRMRGE
ncbi:MAG: hypothetical protein V4564_16400 [Pseudomonadota bacterium]|uniref:hypothetical protein n=1 Tax=Sphingomonas sp. ERG5 TaxID=1381597 RepID=UPI00054B6185|nr:hypothetical protein [Sphingomonas sp. ERG5]